LFPHVRRTFFAEVIEHIAQELQEPALAQEATQARRGASVLLHFGAMLLGLRGITVYI